MKGSDNTAALHWDMKPNKTIFIKLCCCLSDKLMVSSSGHVNGFVQHCN